MIVKRLELTLLTGEEEARLVHTALMLGDHETLSVLLSTLNQVRRTRLTRHYRALYGKKLSRDLEETLAGDYLQICQSIIMEPSAFIVKEIHGLLLEFPSPREELLLSILCERSRDELFFIEESYKRKFMKPLAADIDEFLQPEAARWMKLLITWKEADSCCDLQQASRDTQKLLALGMGVSYGQEGPVIASLLKTRCSSHMRNVFGELRRLGNSPFKMLETAIPHDIKKSINCVLQAIDNPELFNAKALWFTRGEPGRFWRNVLSVRLSRSKEFYKKVEFLFNEQYNVRIQDEIKKDTGESITFLLKRILKF